MTPINLTATLTRREQGAYPSPNALRGSQRVYPAQEFYCGPSDGMVAARNAPPLVHLHIGVHRTGSTSIQQSLHNDSQRLLKSGYDLYPGLLFPANHVELHIAAMRPGRSSPIQRLLPSDQIAHLRAAAKAHVASWILSSPAPNLVFSAEGLSYLRHKDELQRLAALFQGAQVRVIVYLRERQPFLASYRRLLSRMDIPPSDDPTSFAYVADNTWLLDHEGLLHAYAQQFGASNILVQDYDKEIIRNGSVLPSLYSALGLDHSWVPTTPNLWLNSLR